MESEDRRVYWHGRCVYTAIDANGIFEAMFIDGDGMGLKADDSKWSNAGRQKFDVCAGGELVCILIFGCKKRWSIKDDKFSRVVH